jgi:hypothetical protein
VTRDELLEHMAQAVHAHCELDEELLIAEVLLEAPARMLAALNGALQRRFTDAEFAAFMLRAAKRIRSGPAD